MISIPGYRILRGLGEGGMATVYLAVQESLDREVAVKVMSPDLASDAEFCQRFLKEGRTLAQVSHPNVVAIYDCGEREGVYYMCMEFVRGGTLEDVLEKSTLPLSECVRTIQQMGSALAWSHSKGLIHRDVKPANVLYREDGTAVLSDFGIAKATRAEATKMTAVGVAIGTPTYMSPEQATAQELTSKSDQYSLGVMFYEMLAGKAPYAGDTALAVAVQHVQAPVPALPDELDHLQPVIDRMMAKKPDDRFSTMQELNITLDRLISAQSDGAKTEALGSVSVTLPTPKAKPMFFAAVSMGAVAVAALLIYVVVINKDVDTGDEPMIEIVRPAPLDETAKEDMTKWLNIAQMHFDIGRLFDPPGNNALDAYWKVLEVDATNATAMQGLTNIATSLGSLAQESLDDGDVDESRRLVNKGLMADPDNKQLAELQNELNNL